MVIDIVEKLYDEMHSAEKKVADYIVQNPTSIISMNVADVAKASDTSEATVVRASKHLGFTGFHQLKLTLASEYGYGDREKLDGAFRPQDVAGFLSVMSSQVLSCSKTIDQQIIDACVDRIREAKCVYIVGWGNSGAIAMDVAHRLGRQGKRTFVSAVADYFLTNMYLAEKEDLLIAISHSGTSIHVCQALEIAKDRGIPSILITNSPQSQAESLASYVLCTDIEGELFSHFGGESHLFEMLVVDMLVYFHMCKVPNAMDSTDPVEIVLSQYKI